MNFRTMERIERAAVAPLLILFLVLLFTSPVYAEQTQALIEKVKIEYKKGDYEKAMKLLLNDLKENPDDGTTHYYLGLVKQEMGEDLPALQELELAARLLPADTLAAYTKQAVEHVKSGKNELPEKPKPKDWFENITDSVNQFFGGTTQNQTPNASGQLWQMPDFMAGVDEAYRQARRQAKNFFKGKNKKKGRHGSYQSWAAKTMSMADIQDLVRKSRVINPSWGSHPDGLKSYRQAPANTPAWDYWIARYKRSFQYILMSHLAKEGEVRPYGSVACIFSIDNKGNLRGHIYASTASARLNRCLIKTVRELNHSRVLKFPKGAKITGYNFQMKWDFGKLLRYIAYVRAVKKHQAELKAQAKAKKEAEAKLLAQKEAKAKIIEAKKKARIARQKRLALLRKKRLEREKQYTRKAEVEGVIIPKPKPVELRAKQLTLADVPFTENLDTSGGDPFSQIDDRQIMRWPDVNR